MSKPSKKLDEAAISSLLMELREPPRAWIDAAKELPAARGELAGIVARANADAEYRNRLLEDLEEALRAEGHEPTPQAVAALRAGIQPD